MEKTEGEILKEKLFNEKKVGWETTTEEEKEKIFKFADEYMYFMNHSKTAPPRQPYFQRTSARE